MPFYNYHCSSCGFDFEANERIENRFIPTEKPCIRCGESNNIALIICSPKIVSGVGDVRSKIDSGFKDNLNRIKEKNPGSRIETA